MQDDLLKIYLDFTRYPRQYSEYPCWISMCFFIRLRATYGPLANTGPLRPFVRHLWSSFQSIKWQHLILNSYFQTAFVEKCPPPGRPSYPWSWKINHFFACSTIYDCKQVQSNLNQRPHSLNVSYKIDHHFLNLISAAYNYYDVLTHVDEKSHSIPATTALRQNWLTYALRFLRCPTVYNAFSKLSTFIEDIIMCHNLLKVFFKPLH